MSKASISTASASSSAEGRGVGAIRRTLKLLALGLWSAGWFLAWALGSILVLGIPAGRRRIRRAVFGPWARGVTRILGVQVSVAGSLVRPPFLVVANHLGYLDIVVLAGILECVFVAKSDVRDWPVIGFLAGIMDTIFVDRTASRDSIRAMDRISDAISNGAGVVLFAEATSSDGSDVLPFRPALLEWAARTGEAVHHASLSYRTAPGTAPAHLAVCWWGDMTFLSHLVAMADIPRIHATVVFGDAPIHEPDRKLLADRLHQAVRQRFVPVVTR